MLSLLSEESNLSTSRPTDRRTGQKEDSLAITRENQMAGEQNDKILLMMTTSFFFLSLLVSKKKKYKLKASGQMGALEM